MKRAAVVVPPLSDFYFTRHRFSILGAHIVAELLSGMGVQTTLLNLPLLNIKGTPADLPEPLSHLGPYLVNGETGRLSFFTSWRSFGPKADTSVELIAAARPDICFFSLFAFCYADAAIDLARRVKARLPRVPLVIGGAGVGVFPAYFLGKGAFNHVLPGEAEACLPPFMAEIRKPMPDFSRVPGAVSEARPALSDGSDKSDPSDLATPDAMRIPLVQTARSSRSSTWSVSLARGCPKRCSFCSSSLLSGHRLRTASIDRLDRLLKERSGEIAGPGRRPIVNLEDDNLLCDEAYLKAAIALFRKHLPGVEFVAENGLDYALLSPERCDRLIANGMRKFNLSLASTSAALLQRKGRNLDLDRYERVVAFLAAKQVPVVTYFICGFPEDTVETVAASLRYLDRQPTMIGISPFYPVPGLPGFEDRRRFEPGASCRSCGSALYPWNGSLSTATMVTAFRLARWSNLRKTSPEIRTEAENVAMSKIEQTGRLHTVVRNERGQEVAMELTGLDKELEKKMMNDA